MKKILSLSFILFTLLFTIISEAATWYVDPAASGSNNGTSWTNAWTSPASMTRLSAGDIVYFSGGSTGNTQTYTMATRFTSLPGYTDGTVGNPITYKIGQDASHNGTAIFDFSGANYKWAFSNTNNIIFSGDAGDGNQHFQIITGSDYGIWAITSGATLNSKFSYIKADNLADSSINGSNVNGIEIDHGWFRITHSNSDHFLYARFTGTTWDQNSIHDCTIYVPYNDPGHGADCLQWVGVGFSIYNNTIIGYYQAGTYQNQHADGWQGAGGPAYAKIYNNKIINIGNYGLYAEAWVATFSHIYIYNNIVCISNSDLRADELNPAGIVLSQKINTGPSEDIVIANNTAYDYSGAGGRAYAIKTISGIDFTDCYFRNNISVNSQTAFDVDASYTSDHNVSITASNAPNTFASYTAYAGLSNNMNLIATDTVAKDQGDSLSSFFTDAFNGALLRPQGTAWDIGAYEYVEQLLNPGISFSGISVN